MDLRIDNNKTHVKRDWITCSKYTNYYRLVSWYNWGGGHPYDQILSTTIFALIMNRILIRALNTIKENPTSTIWIC